MQIIHKKEVYYSLVRIGRFESFMRHEFDSLMTEICLTFYIHKLRAKVSFFYLSIFSVFENIKFGSIFLHENLGKYLNIYCFEQFSCASNHLKSSVHLWYKLTEIQHTEKFHSDVAIRRSSFGSV